MNSFQLGVVEYVKVNKTTLDTRDDGAELEVARSPASSCSFCETGTKASVPAAAPRLRWHSLCSRCRKEDGAKP